MYIGPMRLAVLAYDKISPFMLSTPLAVFGEPFLAGGHRIDVCSSQSRLAASGGLTIETSCPLEAARDADVVILPGWRNADEPVSPAILAELQAAEARGAIVVGLCLGAFGLAEAGLLDGAAGDDALGSRREFRSPLSQGDCRCWRSVRR